MRTLLHLANSGGFDVGAEIASYGGLWVFVFTLRRCAVDTR